MKVLSFLACEDVRHEIGGKVSLMGAFEGLTIDARSITSWPLVVRVAGQLRFMLEEGDKIPDEVALSIRFGGSTLIDGVAPIAVTRRDLPIAVIAPGVVASVIGPGEFVFSFLFRYGGVPKFGPFDFSVRVEMSNFESAGKAAST
jgi:hypothetical protein